MHKIPTIFDRDWEGNRGVVDKLKTTNFDFEQAIPTEKVDGTNVRVTIRSGKAVRLEKRCNPNKRQKLEGIEEPWYIDADQNDPQDKWIWDALNNSILEDLPDGEWSAEAIGKNIQGNPLKLEGNRLLFFTLGQAPVLENVPTTFDELKAWLPKQRSKLNPEAYIEGIVWHHPDGSMVKIKAKDFK